MAYISLLSSSIIVCVYVCLLFSIKCLIIICTKYSNYHSHHSHGYAIMPCMYIIYIISAAHINRMELFYTQLSGPGSESVIIWFRLLWLRLLSLILVTLVRGITGGGPVVTVVDIPFNWLAIELLLKLLKSGPPLVIRSEPADRRYSSLLPVPFRCCRRSTWFCCWYDELRIDSGAGTCCCCCCWWFWFRCR